MEGFAKTIYELRYRKGNESWEQCTNRVIDSVVSIRGDLPLEALTAIEIVRTAMNNFEFLPAGRYLAAAGTKHPQVKNCYCLDMEDSKESIAKVYQDVALLSMTGAGVGINFSKVRAKGDLISTTGGFASGPLCYMEAICAIGRASMSAGYRRAALYGELSWKHKDIFDFINTKQRSELERQLKTSNYDHVLPLDIMNISVSYDKEFLEAYNNTAHVLHEHAHKVFDLNVHLSLTSADPGFAFHVLDDKYILKNACTEFCSDVSGNSCNLGSIYLNKFVNRQEEFRALVDATVLFLMLGNEYSSYPKQEWADIAKETNQIGLGLAGISEFLIRTNSGYNFTPAMREMAEIFEEQSERSATTWAEVLRVNRPAKIRAIAPTGTTSIIASTTSGVEPIFACAYERGYLGKDNKWTHELVIDAAAQRLLDEGFEPEEIFDSYSLGFEQRVAFQAELQKYVDQAISSTVNLPNTQFPKEEAKSIILKYMPYLKGLTTYPDGAVSNQPLRRVELKEALKRKNSVIDESENTRQCKGGSCSL